MKFYISETQNLENVQPLVEIEAKDLTSAKRQATIGQVWVGSTLKVYSGKSGLLLSTKAQECWVNVDENAVHFPEIDFH